MNVALSQPPQVDLVDPRHDGGAPMSSSKEQGPHWPRVVHTARTPDPHGVHPTLVQWRPTLVEWTLGGGWDRVRGALEAKSAA